ncbi:unnamed protein product [Ophioblennius macclurei]
MMNYSSVDWLAQSCFSGDRRAPETQQADGDADSRRPHIPCMVQPAPPTLGKSHLQTKPTPKPAEPQQEEEGNEQESRLWSPNCESSGSKTSDYSSGDENKPGFPLAVSARVHARRGRTKFTSEQVAKLEKIFNKYKYVDIVRRVKTAKKLGLKETQVRTWFQNRRMRMKRALQDSLDSEMAFRPVQRMIPVQYLNRRPYGTMGQMLCQLQMPLMPPWPQLVQLPHLYYRTSP